MFTVLKLNYSTFKSYCFWGAYNTTTALEEEIYNLVYKLYELTYDRVKVIDPEFSLRKKQYEAIKLMV
jgi:hypothetical protein